MLVVMIKKFSIIVFMNMLKKDGQYNDQKKKDKQ
jgi:hypothetical protein